VITFNTWCSPVSSGSSATSPSSGHARTSLGMVENDVADPIRTHPFGLSDAGRRHRRQG
jgi:hypothetical protein